MDANKRETINVVTLLRKTGLQNHESPVDAEPLKDVVIAFYFSAHW